MQIFRSIALACALVVLLTGVKSSGQAPPLTDADFFSDQVVHEIQIRLHAGDWQLLREKFSAKDYYPCDFVWRDQNVGMSGCRSAGFGSANPTKPNLRVDFNYNVTGQQFLGMGSVRLDNAYQDPSMLRDRLSNLFLTRIGQPAPRVSHARVFVNGESLGLYSVIESIDRRFLQRQFGENDGYLFEYKWREGYNFEYKPFPGLDLANYDLIFDAKTHEHESLFNRYAPIERLLRASNESPDAMFSRDVEPYVSLEPFIAYLANDNFLAEWDGILGFAGTANFYIYRLLAGHSRFIAWDKDRSFHTIDYPLWHNVNNNVLVRRSLNVPELRGTYLQLLLRSANTAGPDPATPNVAGVPIDLSTRTCPAPAGQRPCGWLEEQVQRSSTLIRAAAREDRVKPYSNEEFEIAVRFLKQFALQRADYVRCEVAKAAPQLVPDQTAACAQPVIFNSQLSGLKSQLEP